MEKIIDSSIEVKASEQLKKAVASELEIPDPDEVKEIVEESKSDG